MSLADLKSKIISDAQKEAEEIQKKAEKEAQKILDDARKCYQELRRQVEKEAQRLANERYQNIVTLARVQGRNKVLAVKRAIVDEVFQKVEEKLRNLTREEFRRLLIKLLLKYAPKEDTRVIVGKKNANMVDKTLIETINMRLKSSGRFILDTSSDRNFDYGVYLVTKWVEIDLTFKGILRSIREDMEMEVIKILFGKGY